MISSIDGHGDMETERSTGIWPKASASVNAGQPAQLGPRSWTTTTPAPGSEQAVTRSDIGALTDNGRSDQSIEQERN